nr:lipocalin family protein [Pokkaliibacter plantistimulans]
MVAAYHRFHALWRSLRHRISLLLVVAAGLAGCTAVPSGVTVVEQLPLQPYLGRWYEIARLDHSFERGLSCVTADYSLRDDGGVRVINRGYDPKTAKWRVAEGKAYRNGEGEEGRLKVSFFGPFYGAYNVMAVDLQQGYSLVAGPDHDYLWILARQPSLPAETYQQLLQRAAVAGFVTDDLIRVEQQACPQP